MSQRKDIWRLRTLANLQVAQLFIPKTPDNKPFLCTEEEYRDYLTGKRHPQSQAVARANSLAVQKHRFHDSCKKCVLFRLPRAARSPR